VPLAASAIKHLAQHLAESLSRNLQDLEQNHGDRRSQKGIRSTCCCGGL
jgi:hypothetical protein